MDKNTLTGIVLIALLFLGFMWLTPKPEPSTQQISQNTETQQQTSYVGADSLSQSELGWLKENIRANGKTIYNDSTATTVLSSTNYNISLQGDEFFYISLQGYYNVAYIYPCKLFELDETLKGKLSDGLDANENN